MQESFAKFSIRVPDFSVLSKISLHFIHVRTKFHGILNKGPILRIAFFAVPREKLIPISLFSFPASFNNIGEPRHVVPGRPSMDILVRSWQDLAKILENS